jgi:uncharacterized protein
MRRAEFEVKDEAAFEGLLAECEYGTLSLIDGEEPYGVPVNFVWHGGAICFHGAREGRKAGAIAKNPKASFLVVKPYSLIPSYFSDTRAACPATQFFASAHIAGSVMIVEDDSEKCGILNAIMQKLQPDGGYEPIDAANPIYTKMVAQTAVWKLTPTHTSMKVKAGQNLTDERKASIINQLANRGSELDKATIEVIQKNGQK